MIYNLDMDIKHDLGRMRNKLGVSQEWLADKMSVSRQTISKWENGDALPSTKHLLMLMDIFDCADEISLRTGFKKKYRFLFLFSGSILALAVFYLNIQIVNSNNPCSEVYCCEETGVCVNECYFNKSKCPKESNSI